jgi:regulator of CtrA degradation
VSEAQKEKIMAKPQSVVLSIAERMIAGPVFGTLFREGMKLVEDAANYLDKQGRQDVTALPGPVRLAYATASMQLTTQLMRQASWLLLHRSVKDGDRTLEECAARGIRVEVPVPTRVARFDELPEGLKQIITRSAALSKDILRLDGIFHPPQ